MNKLLFCALLLLAGAALAQAPRNRRPAPQDAMEPGVNTSAPAAPADCRRPRATPAAAAAKPPAGAANKPAAKPAAG